MDLNVRTSPPFNRLPSENDLSDLPLWGVVAAVSRIAERIEPVVISGFSHYPKKHLSFIRRARIWAAKSAASAGNTPAPKGVQSAHRALSGVANEILDAIECVSAATQGKTSGLGQSILATARMATMRLMTLDDEVGANALVDAVLKDVSNLRDWHVENRAHPQRAIKTSQFGALWASGEPARVFEDRLRMFLQKQGIDAFRRHFHHEYDNGYSWPILPWLPRNAGFAFCIRSLWALDHFVGRRLGRYQYEELAQIRVVIEELRRGCSSGTPTSYPHINNGERLFCLTKPRTLTLRAERGEVLCALLVCATYHLLIAGDGLQSIHDAIGQSMSLVLLSLEYEGSEDAATIRREIDKDFLDMLALSRRMPWTDDTGIDPAQIGPLRNAKTCENRIVPRRSEVEQAVRRYHHEYGEPGAALVKRCVFCGKPPSTETNEHVVPLWLMRMTGDAGRVVPLHINAGKIIKKPFSSYKFPACKRCNDKYGQSLENAVRPIFMRLSEGKPTYHDELELVLDLLDKIRIGVWVGELMRRDNAYRVVPKFHIEHRIGTTDRLFFIARCASATKGLSFEPRYDPIFAQIPSFFLLCANEIAIVSVSSIGVASRLLGIPFLAQRSWTPDDRIQCRWVPSLKIPVRKRLTFVDHRFMVVAQAILPERQTGDIPYHSEVGRFFKKGSRRSRIHVIAEGQVTRLGQKTPFYIPSTFEECGFLHWVSRAVFDEARRWVSHASPPPPLTEDEKVNRTARKHHFDRLKLAELGYLCSRPD